MNFSYTSYLREYGKIEILKELVKTLFGRFRDLTSYSKLFNIFIDSLEEENKFSESSIEEITSLLFGFNTPNIDEKLFPLYSSLCTTFSPLFNEDNFVLLPSNKFSFFNLFDKFELNSEFENPPFFIATLPLYVNSISLLIPAISIYIISYFDSDNSYLLAEEIFGPSVIFASYFAEHNTEGLSNYYFLFKEEFEKFGELKDLENTSNFYLKLSQQTSEHKDRTKKLNSVINCKWNFEKSIKLYKEYILLNIPPSEVYLNGKNEPATLPDIINAAWFFFLERFLYLNDITNLLCHEQECNFHSNPFHHSRESGNQDKGVNAPFRDITDFSALIIKGIETSNIFRKLSVKD